MSRLSNKCRCSTDKASAVQIDYKQHGVQVVMEGTGVNLTRKSLQPYFDAGVAKVVVSAPVKDANDPVLNIVVGCNDVRLHSSCLMATLCCVYACASATLCRYYCQNMRHGLVNISHSMACTPCKV